MVGKLLDGDLYVIRGKNWEDKVQYCPFQSHMKQCGDWCPNFDIEGDGNRYAVILRCGSGCEIVLMDNPWINKDEAN